MRFNLLTIAITIAMLTCVQTPAYSQAVPIGVRGSVPQCTHAQLHAGTCQQAVAGYIATITNGLSGAPNRCAAGAGTGSDQVTCRFRGGIWTEFEPIAATGLTNPLVSQLNAAGNNINQIGTILVPDSLSLDLDTDLDASGGDMFRIRDRLGNALYEFPQTGKAHLGNSAAGGFTGAAGTLDETALLVSGNVEVDGGTIALGTVSGGTATDGEVIFWANFAPPLDIIQMRPRDDVATTSWDWRLPPDDGNAGQLLSTDGSGITTWATDDDVPESGDFAAAVALEADGSISTNSVPLAAMADDSIGIDELDLITGDTPANGDCLTYDTGAGGTIEAIPCPSGSTGSITFSGIQAQSNTSVQIRLDANSDGTENFEVRDGGDLPRFAVGESGAVSMTGAGGTSIFVPNGSGTVVYTLPIDDGDAGEKLQTNGSGTLSWEPSALISGSRALATAPIASGACSTVDTGITAAGVATTDIVSWGFSADVTAVTGYAPVTTGALSIYAYPTAGGVNFKVCNPTASSITPGAITLNWRVVR